MRYVIGFVFLLLSLWQFIMFKRTLSHIKQEGNKNTSPFIMLSLWGGLIIAVIFLSVALACFL